MDNNQLKIGEQERRGLLTKWVGEQFLFNRRLCFYNSYEDVKVLPDLPQALMHEGFDGRKSSYKSPLEHMVAVCMGVGKQLQEDESQNAIKCMCQIPEFKFPKEEE